MEVNEVIRHLSIILSTFHAVILNYLTVVPRCAQKKFFQRTLVLIAVLAATTAGAVWCFGLAKVSAWVLPLIIFPSLVCFFACSQYRDGRFLLGIFLGDVFATIATNATAIIAALLGNNMWFVLISWGLLFPAAEYIFYRYYRATYRLALAELGKMNWWMLSAVLVLYYVVFTYVTSYPAELSHHLEGVPLFLLLVLLTVLTFSVIYYVLRDQLRMRRYEQAEKLLAVQMQSFDNAVEAMEHSEANLRILRHDMRHYKNLLREMLQSGDSAGALALLGGMENALDSAKPAKYCDVPALNIVLRYYSERAEAIGCRLTTRIRLEHPLPADTAGLCIVISNALENAVNACAQIPEPDKREIKVTCVDSPAFALGIYNTYRGEIHFGEDGLPLTPEPGGGHGYGVQSICAFARKAGALLDYDADGQWFKMRLVINPPADEK